MAAVVGLYLLHLRRPALPMVVLWGARAQFMTGLVLAGLLESGAVDDEPNRTKLAVKLLVAVVVVALVESNHKKDLVPAECSTRWAHWRC